MVFRVYADELTMDKVADKALSLGGSIPGNWVVVVPRGAGEMFARWLDHIGVEYEETKVEATTMDRGCLVVSHLLLATFGRPW
jgi:hypothetical protein